MDRRKQGMAVAAAVLFVAGCSSSDSSSGSSPTSESPTSKSPSTSESPSTSTNCVQLSPKVLNQISEGLIYSQTKIVDGAAVPLPDDEQQFGIEYVAALEVDNGSSTETVFLGLGAPQGSIGPIIVGDNVARVFFDWGTAAQEGSPMRDYQDTLFLTDAADEAKECLG
jgi:hypothetical protein